MIVSENYLDPDVAYFLGMISARGVLHESAGDKKIVIDFPFGSFNAEGVNKRSGDERRCHGSGLKGVGSALEDLWSRRSCGGEWTDYATVCELAQAKFSYIN